MVIVRNPLNIVSVKYAQLLLEVLLVLPQETSAALNSKSVK